MDNNGDEVICELCGKSLSHITWTHLKACHDMKVAEYREMFPGLPLQSTDYIEDRIEPLRGTIQPVDLCTRRSLITQEWWDSEKGTARKEDLSRNPLVLRGGRN